MNIFLVMLLSLVACSKEKSPNNPDQSMYFPSDAAATWETTTPVSLGWNQAAIQPLKDYLAAKRTTKRLFGSQTYQVVYDSCKRANSYGRIF